MKKFFFFILIMQFTYLTAFAEELLPIDVVLVLDVSRSMATADPEKISRDAMHLFIEKLSEERDRVGIVAYAGNVERSVGLREIENRETLKNFIDALEYASWTDHGVGLLEAVRMLTPAESSSRQGIIVFLTDGNMNVNPWGSRTNEQAQNDVQEAISTARELNIPIHAIGLNFDGNLAWEPIGLIADATNGLAFETADAQDIPEIINAFFHVMIAAPQTRIEEPKEPPPRPGSIAGLTPSEWMNNLRSERTNSNPITSANEGEFHDSPQATQTLNISTEQTESTYENVTRIKILIVAAIGFLLAAAFLFVKITKSKRVFTGKVIVKTVNQPGMSRTVNLIEYGNRVSLGSLLQSDTRTVFDYVMLAPSPTAPSHLPQLQIKCKNHAVKFTKDFLTRDISNGTSITIGTEAIIAADDVQILLKYTA